MEIQRAIIDDDKVLTEITKKSKAFWGYSDDQLSKWSKSLTITEAYIETNNVYKLLVNRSIVGYYSYFTTDKNTIKLDC